MEVSPLHVQLGAHHFNLRAEAGPTALTRFSPLIETKGKACKENGELARRFYAHEDNVVIKQYDSLCHCVLFILIEE